MSEFTSANGPNISLKALTESELLVPRYDKESQLHTADLDVLYPEWRENHPDKDPELILFDFVRTHEQRRIASLRGISNDFATEGLEKAVMQLPEEVGRRFQAHGIAGKHGSSSSELDTLLTQGIDTSRHLYSTELRYNPEISGAIGADMPFTEGGVFIVSDLDAQLDNQGIKYVVLGEQYVKCLDAMQSRYPNVKIVPWHNAPEFFCKIVNSYENTDFSPVQTDYSRSYEIGQNDHLPGGHLGAVSVHETVSPILLSNDTDIPDIW